MTIIQTNDDGCGLSATHNNNSSTEIIRQRTSSPTQTDSGKFEHRVELRREGNNDVAGSDVICDWKE